MIQTDFRDAVRKKYVLELINYCVQANKTKKKPVSLKRQIHQFGCEKIPESQMKRFDQRYIGMGLLWWLSG